MLRKCKPEPQHNKRERERKQKDTAFHEQLNETKVEQIQLARRDVNDSIDKFKRERSNAGEEMNEEKMLESSLKVVDRAWKQCIKYGMMCFLVSPHASDDTEKGKVVRHNLKDVWGTHRKCDEIKD